MRIKILKINSLMNETMNKKWDKCNICLAGLRSKAYQRLLKMCMEADKIHKANMFKRHFIKPQNSSLINVSSRFFQDSE